MPTEDTIKQLLPSPKECPSCGQGRKFNSDLYDAYYFCDSEYRYYRRGGHEGWVEITGCASKEEN